MQSWIESQKGYHFHGLRQVLSLLVGQRLEHFDLVEPGRVLFDTQLADLLDDAVKVHSLQHA